MVVKVHRIDVSGYIYDPTTGKIMPLDDGQPAPFTSFGNAIDLGDRLISAQPDA